jgi:hypothetical protein
MRRLDLLPIRAGEGRSVALVGLVATLYAAAVAVGDVVAQSIFIERAGADALPRIFLLKAGIDAVAAALYLPATRGRKPAAVLRLALVLYAAVVVGGRALVATRDGGAAATALYVAHECAWTVLTIHWGVYLLDVFDASQARRLFPILFGATRLGGALAGGILAASAVAIGADQMLHAAALLALLAAGASFLTATSTAAPATPLLGAAASEAAVDAEAAHATARGLRGWRAALSSPLVRAIALSTASMVLVRYALRLVASGQLEVSFGGDENRIAAFLGRFDLVANIASAALGVLVLPRLLARAGAGAINLAYAVATAIAQAAAVIAPSLGSAALARFVEIPLKDAVKTPLSALFYGAERPAQRGPARALVFGAVIPAASIVSGVLLEMAGHSGAPLAVAGAIGLGAALLFTAASARQNHAWRAGLSSLVDWKLERAAARGQQPDPELLATAQGAMSAARDAAPPGRAERLDAIAHALAARDPRLRAVGEELLAETIARGEAQRIVRAVIGSRRG